jgi:hypothetical protein
MSEYKMRVYKTRNVFKPRWWQFRMRFQIWCARRNREKMLAQMDPVVRQAYEDTCAEVERRILFGEGEN